MSQQVFAKVVNVTEEIVHGIVRFLLNGPEYPTYCKCEQCEVAILAEALNHLQNRFVTTNLERTHMYEVLKRSSEMAEINKQVIRAIHVIGKQKKH